MALHGSNLITGLMKDAILKLCQENLLYQGKVEIDGIICITGEEEGQQIVVKVHEQLSPCETDSVNPMLSLLANYSNNEPSRPNSNHGHLSQADHRDNLSETSHEDRFMDIKSENVSPAKKIKLENDYSGLEELQQQYEKTDSNVKAYPSMLNALKKPIVTRPSPIHSRLDKVAPAAAGTLPDCKTCDLSFDTFDALQEHNDLRHNSCTCHHCYRTFTSRSNLERHLRLHTGQKPYVCLTCGKAFSRKDHLGNHVAKHAFKCGTCLKRFSDREGLGIHYEQDHDQKLYEICFQCNKGFSDANVYLEHKKLHPVSSGVVESNNNHKESTRSFHISPAKIAAAIKGDDAITIHTCEICHFSCTGHLVLQKHKMTHGEMQCSFTCISCLQRFTDPIQYESHLEIEHPNETYIFECVFCRRINKTFNELKKHEACHLHIEGRYSCQQCSLSFKSKESLSEHLKNHNKPLSSSSPNNAKFRCSSCDLCFVKLSELGQHQQEEKHSGWKVRVPSNNDVAPRPIVTPQKLMLADENSEEAMDLSPIVASAKHFPKEEIEEEEEEILVIQPEAPEDSLDREEDYSRDFVITDNPTSVIEVPNEKKYEGVDVSRMSPAEPDADAEKFKSQNIEDADSVNSVPSSDGSFTGKTNGSGSETQPKVNSRYTQPVVDGPFTCSHCKIDFPQYPEFETHVYQNHYRYPCMFCPKTFGQKANRDRHMCIHTGEKPFSCPECKEAFSRGDKLKHHRTKVHGVQVTPIKGQDNTSQSGSDIAPDIIQNNGGEVKNELLV